MDSEASDKLGSVVRRRDLYFHEPRYRDVRWLETNWFSWILPEQNMRCHIRAAFRTNPNVVETLVFVFDNTDPNAGFHGVRYIDYAAPRDHSFSPRPESTSGYGYPMSGNLDYSSFGAAGHDFSFFVQTRNDWDDLRAKLADLGQELPPVEDDRVMLTDPEGNPYAASTGGWA